MKRNITDFSPGNTWRHILISSKAGMSFQYRKHAGTHTPACPSGKTLTPLQDPRGDVPVCGLCSQHSHLRPRLLDELLKVDLPQLFGQLLQFLFFVLEAR